MRSDSTWVRPITVSMSALLANRVIYQTTTNEELKEEIDKLQTSVQTTKNYWTSRCHLLEKEIEGLKEKVAELNAMMSKMGPRW